MEKKLEKNKKFEKSIGSGDANRVSLGTYHHIQH